MKIQISEKDPCERMNEFRSIQNPYPELYVHYLEFIVITDCQDTNFNYIL